MDTSNKLDAIIADDILLRVATEEDFNCVMDLCHLLHAENGQYPLNLHKVSELVWRALTRQGAIMGVIGKPGDLKAMICLHIDPVDYADAFQIYEKWNYVRPDSRKSDFAKRMIRFAKQCADETGLDLTIGIISNDRLAAKARLYDRELPKGGVFYVYHGAAKVASKEVA